MSRRNKKQNRKLPYLLLSAAFVLAAGVAALSNVGVRALSGAYPASAVIGQTGYTNNSVNAGAGATSPTAATLNQPEGVAVDSVHHRLFIADNQNNRVLVYTLDASNNLTSATATYVLGQSSVSGYQGNQNGSVGPTTLYGPTSLAYDSTDNLLFVADQTNSRVVVYNTATVSTDEAASYVIGQSNLSSNTTGLTQATLNNPWGIAFDANDHLVFVSDTVNNRVLAYSTTSLSATGENATDIIGQSSFTVSANGSAQGTFGNGTHTNNSVRGVAYDSTDHLVFVSDAANARVLGFSTTSLSATGENASAVIGQTNYTNNSAASATQSSTGGPWALAYDPVNDLLYVGDSAEARVLGFPLSGTITPGENASTVIGEASFTAYAAGSTQTAFNNTIIGGVAIDPSNNQLFVGDSYNHRALQFNLVNLTSPPVLAPAVVGQAYTGSLSMQGSQGTVTYAVSSGTLPPGVTLNTSTGAFSGMPTQAGTYNFEITVTDATSAVGSFIQDPAFTITVTAATSSSGSGSVSAPDTGFGVFTSNPLRILTDFGVVALGLFGSALLIRKYAKR